MARKKDDIETMDDPGEIERSVSRALVSAEEEASFQEKFSVRPGETAKQYRERIAPAFTEHLVRRAVLEKDGLAAGLVSNLMVKDMENKIKLVQLAGPGGIKRMSLEAGADDFREMAGITGIPSGAAGVSMGTMRASDVVRKP